MELYQGEMRDEVEATIRGERVLGTVEARRIGDVDGKRGLHLQCGVGLDTIALARMGASMVGLDVSARAREFASGLAEQCEVDVRFVQGDVMTVNPALTGFDFAYSSNGVLRWLDDLAAWAQTVWHALRPGGVFYLMEIHPLVYRIQAVDTETMVLGGSYFAEETRVREVASTHLGAPDRLRERVVAHTDWTIASILGAIVDQGFRITGFSEYPFCAYSRKGLLQERTRGEWSAGPCSPIPLSFDLIAVREERP